MNKQRLIILAGAAIGIGTSFLPVAMNITWIEKDGFICAFLFAVGAILSVLGNRSEGLSKAKQVTCTILFGAAAAVGIYDVSEMGEAANAVNALSEAFGGGSAVSMTPIYGSIVAGLIGAVAPWAVK